MLRTLIVKLNALRISTAVAVLLGTAGCSVVDMSYQPRAYQVNLGSQNVRENLILLNVARASRFEPMNFTALSKYTASGQLQASTSAVANIGVNTETFRGGPSLGQILSASPSSTISGGALAATNNSFDIASLDNQDFYANFLAPLTPEKIHILVNAGLSRDIVFHSVIRAVKVTLGQATLSKTRFFKELRYTNDPSDDKYGDLPFEEASRRCADEIGGEAENPGGPIPPFQRPIWYGEHLQDCNYSKFLRFIKAGLEYGLTTEVIPGTDGRGGSRKNMQSMKGPQLNIVVTTRGDSGGGGGAGGGGGGGLNGSNTGEVKICFDASIAASNGRRVPEGQQYSSCERGDARTQLKIKTFEPYVETVTPVLQSAYSVFQYYGLLVRTGTAPKVHLTSRAVRRTDDTLIFNIQNDGQGGCYAFVSYSGADYCVPQAKAGNTKEVLTLLVALVNLSTSRSSLPTTPTVLANP